MNLLRCVCVCVLLNSNESAVHSVCKGKAGQLSERRACLQVRLRVCTLLRMLVRA